MNLALFGGTFDPIHAGHLIAARRAARRFHLDRVLFVPSGNPPHKRRNSVTPFFHRYAMVSLACAGQARFVPSLLEAPAADGRLQYSLDTARAIKRKLGRGDHLFFLLGVDAFLDVPHWKAPHHLLDLVDFIVVSRPGFSLEKILQVIPRGLLQRMPQKQGPEEIALQRTKIHVLEGVNVPVASSEIRRAIRQGRKVTGLIPRPVEEYIMKEGIYSQGGKPTR